MLATLLSLSGYFLVCDRSNFSCYEYEIRQCIQDALQMAPGMGRAQPASGVQLLWNTVTLKHCCADEKHSRPAPARQDQRSRPSPPARSSHGSTVCGHLPAARLPSKTHLLQEETKDAEERQKPGKRRKSRTLVVKEGNKRAATFLTEESSMKPPQVPNFWPHRKPAQSHPLNTAANMSAGGQKEKGPSRQHRLADTGKIKTVQSLLLSPAFQTLPSLPASSPSTRCPPPNTRPGSTI